MSAPKIDLYPTPTRKKLCRDIEDGKVRWYRWIDKHWACNTAAGDRAVTADVNLLEHHGLAEILPLPDPRDLYSLVRLTDTGRVWAGISAEATCWGCADDALGPKWGDESLRRPHTCGKDHAAEGGEPKATSEKASDLGGDAA